MIKVFEAMGVSELEKVANDDSVKSVMCVASKGIGFLVVCEMSDKYVAPAPAKKPDRAALKAARQPVVNKPYRGKSAEGAK